MPRNPLDGFDAGAAIMETLGLGKGLVPLAEIVDEQEKEASKDELLENGMLGVGVAPMGVGLLHGELTRSELFEPVARLMDPSLAPLDDKLELWKMMSNQDS